MNDITYAPFVTTEGIWIFAQKNTNLSHTEKQARKDVRASIEVDLGVYTKRGSSWNISANYDGIGNDSFESWGVSLQFPHKF